MRGGEARQVPAASCQLPAKNKPLAAGWPKGFGRKPNKLVGAGSESKIESSSAIAAGWETRGFAKGHGS